MNESDAEVEAQARAIYEAILEQYDPAEDPDPRRTVRVVREIADQRVRSRLIDLLRAHRRRPL